MTDDANIPANRGLTLSATIDAVAAVMRAANPSASPDMALASRVAGDIQPALQQALASGRASSGQELLAGPGFATIVTQYLGSSNSAAMDASQRKAMLDQLRQANVTGADGVAAARALGVEFVTVSSGGRGDTATGNTRSADYAGATDLAKITQDNYPATVFYGVGVSYGTFVDMRGQGFNTQQILSAVSFTKEMGLDVNKGVAVVVRIQRDVPQGQILMRDMRDNEKGLADAKKAVADAQAHGASAEEIARLNQRVKDWEKYGYDYHKGAHAQGVPVGREGDIDQYHRLQQEAHGNLKLATKGMAREKEAELNQAFEDARRYSNDPNAWKGNNILDSVRPR